MWADEKTSREFGMGRFSKLIADSWHFGLGLWIAVILLFAAGSSADRPAPVSDAVYVDDHDRVLEQGTFDDVTVPERPLSDD